MGTFTSFSKSYSTSSSMLWTLLITCAFALTEQEGFDFAKEYLSDLKRGFATNDFSFQHAKVSDTIEWNWSGGVAGKGTKQEYFSVLQNSWQAVVSHFHASNIFPVVDAAKNEISITFEILLNINGRGNGPDCWFVGRNMFSIGLDENKKINKFIGRWNPNDESLNA